MRREHVDLIESLTDDQLARPSLCGGWDVLTCAGHLAYATEASLAGFFVAAIRYGGPHRANTALARAAARRGPAQVAAVLRDNAESRFTPPVVNEHGPITDQLVHGVDIRQPLGIAWSPDPGAVAESLRFLTGGTALGFVGRGRLDGLRIEADDVGFASGAGLLVAGRGIDVAAALCGRSAVMGSLTGDGVDLLRSRVA
jgi:uncharacterized protein (TIGR03083 family)